MCRVWCDARPWWQDTLPRAGTFLALADSDLITQLTDEVREQSAIARPIDIVGGGSKSFLSSRHQENSYRLDVSAHRGVISYEPRELVLRARAGTPVSVLNELVDAEGQMLAFDPPDYGASTLGGTVACGLSGPRRPFTGSVRLCAGCRCHHYLWCVSRVWRPGDEERCGI